MSPQIHKSYSSEYFHFSGQQNSFGCQIRCNLVALRLQALRPHIQGPWNEEGLIFSLNCSTCQTLDADVFLLSYTAGLQRQAVYADKYKLWEWHGRWNSGMCEEQMKGEYWEGWLDRCFHDALLSRIPYGAAVCYLSESRHRRTEGEQAMLTSTPCADAD